MTPATAVILAGHGSHLSPNTAGLVWEYVDQLRAWGIADEITASFWKEKPAFSQVLQTVQAQEVVVVPLFTARGYFSTQVIPAEMGLTGPVTHQADRTIHYTPTLGEHPHLNHIVQERITTTLTQFGLPPDQTAVAIIGHGTPRTRASQNAARQQAADISALGIVAEVVEAYLDDTPDIPSIYARTTAPYVIAVPFFLAQGSHVTQDVPHALGRDASAPNPTEVAGRQVFYTDPVGTANTLCELIVDLLRGAGLSAEKASATAWDNFPKRGREAFLQILATQQYLTIGELLVSQDEVRPLEMTTPVTLLTTPAEIRAMVRETPFRPLSTARDLPRRWRVSLSQPEQAWAVVETIYPGTLTDWHLHQTGQLAVESLSSLAQRQRGMFAQVDSVRAEVIAHQVSGICGRCICQPLWAETHHPTISSTGTLPCATPCNFWLSELVKTETSALEAS